MAVTDPRRTGIQALKYAGEYTYANLPDAVTYSGYSARASDLGANGTWVESTGVRWRPLNGESTLKRLGAPVAAINASETIVLQQLLPVNSWQQYDSLLIKPTLTKSGSTDTGQITVRIGTLGTTSDQPISSLSSFNLMAAGQLSGGMEFEVKLLTATSAQKTGLNTASNGSFGGAGATTAGTATTITDASANALYVSVGFKSSGSTDTLSVLSCHLRLAA